MTVSVDKWSRLAALRPARAARPAAVRAPDEADEVALVLGAVVARNRYGEHLSVRNWYSTPEFREPSAFCVEMLSRNRERGGRRAEAALADASRWLFLDTETTGLAGGTGTYAFLVGIAWWDAGGLQVEQFFLRDFSEEHSVLHEVGERIRERPVLVTFNGKTFDWPLLENRFTMTRAIGVPRLAAHLDLLHPARALWKLRLGSVRLVELERRVLDAPRLGWCRDTDLDSAMIPQVYFDYLRGGCAKALAGVVRHNQMDLRGLAALFGRIDALVTENASAEEEPCALELFGLSKFLHRRGDSARAEAACSKALGSGLPAEFHPAAQRELAEHAARRGAHEEAAALWGQLVADTHRGAQACERLAIHFERRVRDLQRALEFARLGLKKVRVERARGTGRWATPRETAQAARMERNFVRRIERLEHRIGIESAAAPLLAEAAVAAGKSGRHGVR